MAAHAVVDEVLGAALQGSGVVEVHIRIQQAVFSLGEDRHEREDGYEKQLLHLLVTLSGTAPDWFNLGKNAGSNRNTAQ